MTSNDIVLIDLFSGVGGFAMGLEQAGFNITHHYFSEIDKNAISVYKYHFKKAEYVGSVEYVSGTEIRAKHPGARIVVSFGWPCQDNSIAGKRKGHVEGSRSNLLLHAVRIIQEVQPDYYIAENVKGLYSVNEGVDFIEAIRLLSYLNSDCPQYNVEQQLLNTLQFLPQNRDRTYFVGYPTARGCRQILPVREGNEKTFTQRGVNSEGCVNINGVLKSMSVSNCIDANYHKGMDNHGGRTLVKVVGRLNTSQDGDGFTIRRLTEIEIERLQGFPDNHTEIGVTVLCKSNKGMITEFYGFDMDTIIQIAPTQRYKQMGNAVSVPVVKAVGERILNDMRS